MAKVLQLKFKNEAGKNTSMSFTYVNDNLSRETVAKAMEDLAALDLFKDKDGNLLYKTPVSAKYVETTETEVVPAN
ncbi:DUF2922 domain-containing protein [Xylocopilactobacillus apis]|uniref:DUF2922 domain-containing protein n=1 Tax=Xylocopilactobacillus apis TaxID=2932183 RepID=A0AAU9DGS7_9LACO|nr:DUF2922 domain-containing protein [Xylocopilactobacillus apis]BDR55451.1 hypothetical protein KIMC2_00130 [Xylocopilactobacillus apis]BDR57481.1 hypothetical protein KIMC2_20430 [Xylocopilactobacillus apis]